MDDLTQSMRELQVEISPPHPDFSQASVFLHRSGHHGPEQLQERLNNADHFLPLKDGNGNVRLHAKAGIAVLACVQEPEEILALRELLPTTVAVQMRLRDGSELAGDLMLLLPGENHRVLDFLNAPERFFLLTRPAGACFVNKDWVDFVEPAREAR